MCQWSYHQEFWKCGVWFPQTPKLGRQILFNDNFDNDFIKFNNEGIFDYFGISEGAMFETTF